MSTTVSGLTSPAGARARSGVLPALVRIECVRLMRNPVPWLGLALSVWALWTTVPEPGEWPGSSYEGVTPTVAPLLFGISVATAVAFHRGRTEVSPAAPVQEERRALARLLAATPFLAVTAGFAALIAWREHDLGGLWLGMEPGRTTQAVHTTAELSQHLVLGLVAVALGAAFGRRVSRLAAVLPALFVLWFVVMTYWLFAARSVTPFSVIQVQPVHVPVGPPSTDPLSLPADWLLVGPPHSSGWDRQLVSESLAWWHDVWLLGLALLLLAVAWPPGGRRRLAAAGVVLAVLGVVGQQVVIP